jgi:hypothetical protein
MDMLIIRPRTRDDAGGVTSRIAVWRQKSRKYGPATMERALRCRQDLAVYGPHQAGKSRWLNRMHEHAATLWIKRPAALFRGLEPLATWLEQPEVIAWRGQREDVKPWEKLRQTERLAALLAWMGEAKPVVFLDDAHKLTGRKADVAVQIARAAGVVVHAATEEARLPMSLRMVLQQRDPQIVRLTSEAAYDYTDALIWMLCIICAAAGAWPVAGAIAGLKVLGKGGRAAKQA